MNKNVKRKSGFSLLELVVVVILMGIIGAVVGPKLFSTTDEAKIGNQISIAGTGTTIVQGAVAKNKGNILNINANNEGYFNVDNVPNELTYAIGIKNSGTDSARYIIAKTSSASDTVGRELLKKTVLAMDRKFDGTASGAEDGTRGKFLYNITCDTANVGNSDCYYKLFVSDMGLSSSDTWQVVGDIPAHDAGATDDLDDTDNNTIKYLK